METIGTSCYTSNFNYVGFSPFSSTTNSCSYHHNLNDENYDIKPFEQYPYVVGANGLVSNIFVSFLFTILANVR